MTGLRAVIGSWGGYQGSRRLCKHRGSPRSIIFTEKSVRESVTI